MEHPRLATELPPVEVMERWPYTDHPYIGQPLSAVP
jgi:hypothetical protein